MQTIISPVSLLAQDNFLDQWQDASWDDYLTYSDTPTEERIKLYYYEHKLLIEMGKEGINHSSICDLFTILIFIWFNQKETQVFSSYGRCLLEKKKEVAAAPDLVLYLGENYPQWQVGERRYLDLNKWGRPNLVGEISDTTLATDLDEKKHLYASLKIPEYWVIDVLAKRVFCFQLQENNKYQESDFSLVLKDLPISLLNESLARLERESNGTVAGWFSSQISQLKEN